MASGAGLCVAPVLTALHQQQLPSSSSCPLVQPPPNPQSQSSVTPRKINRLGQNFLFCSGSSAGPCELDQSSELRTSTDAQLLPETAPILRFPLPTHPRHLTDQFVQSRSTDYGARCVENGQNERKLGCLSALGKMCDRQVCQNFAFRPDALRSLQQEAAEPARSCAADSARPRTPPRPRGVGVVGAVGVGAALGVEAVPHCAGAELLLNARL
eukprot:CAMPEP_0173297516 /NCGR_PEP_ID=MMETSP1143-20121109/15576_1 /TAXON_ID=483371 /ORGANISM="non described non described, Strain CCMP2298" /LENGTH=212 /DNA_ID=CAMNT_0014237521 /DNA_START=583 /DNA_END=1222 /DNA_ORIENTATION=+